MVEQEVKLEISRKKEARNMKSINITEEDKNRYKNIKNKYMTTILNAIRENVEDDLAELDNCPNRMFGLAKELDIDCKEVKG